MHSEKTRKCSRDVSVFLKIIAFSCFIEWKHRNRYRKSVESVHAQNQTRRDSSGSELPLFTLFLRLHLHRLGIGQTSNLNRI